jgi:hypothetical protein
LSLLTEYWHSLEDVLTQYVGHNDNKFDYDNEGITHRKHIVADGIIFIGMKCLSHLWTNYWN